MSEPRDSRWPLTRGQTAAVAMLLLAFGLLIAYLQWDAWAERMVQAQIDAAHARGEFILLDEFPASQPLPDEQNAAIFWTRAAADAELTQDQNARERDLDDLGLFPPTAAELAFLREILKHRENVWLSVERTRNLHGVDWQIEPIAMVQLQKVPALNAVRHLANLLSYHALVAHVDGNDLAVIADVHDILRESRAIESLPASLVTHLVSVGVSAVAVATIERVVPDLQIAEVLSDDVRTLIDALLDESVPDSGFGMALQAERASTLHWGQTVTGKPVFGTTQKIALARTLKWQARLNDARQLTSYPAVQKFLTANPPPPRHVYGYIPSLPSILQPSLVRVFELHFRIRTDRRLAALALAIRWYQCDHNGKLPDRLEQLVPKHLPAVPLDPLAPDGRAIAYRATGERPLIYSVGMDAIDDGGSTEFVGKPRAGRGQSDDRWHQKDAVMYLVRIPRELPATQPADE